MALLLAKPEENPLVEGCKEWKEAKEKFKRNQLYTPEDESFLVCIVRRNKAEIRAGSAAGHMTHVYWNGKKELHYYDADDDVNRVMKALFEDAGAKCKLTDYGVYCDLSGVEDLKEIFRRISAATSMDYRLENPYPFWIGTPAFTKCWGKKGEEFEFCAVKEMLKE